MLWSVSKMDPKKSKTKSTPSTRLSEALLMYLDCWPKKERLFSGLYGKEEGKGFIFYNHKVKACKSRIELLQKYDVPIQYKRVDDVCVKKGTRVWVDRMQLIRDFRNEIKALTELTKPQRLFFQAVLDAALPHIHFQVRYYYQNQVFFNKRFGQRIKNTAKKYCKFTKKQRQSKQSLTIKYYPILLSFSTMIDAGDKVKERRWHGLNFRELLDLAQEKGLIRYIKAYILAPMPGVKESLEIFSSDYSRAFTIVAQE